MPRIKDVGEYAVVIESAKWTKMEAKEGKPAYMAAHLEFKTEAGDTIDKLIHLTPTLIQSGQNAGKSWQAVNINLLKEIGLPDNILEISEMVGKECHITCEEDEYQGKTYLQVAWVNPPRKSYQLICGILIDNCLLVLFLFVGLAAYLFLLVVSFLLHLDCRLVHPF